MKGVLKPLAKTVLIPLELKTSASATDAAIQKKIFGSSMATLTISNEEMNDIMKIAKSLEDFGLLIKSISETIKNETKKQKGRFLSIFPGTLAATLLVNLLTSKGKIRVSEGTIEQVKIFNATSSLN